MRTDLVRLSEDVHALSYRLHPSMLDDLGLVEALRAECDRVASHGDVRVDVTADGLPDTVPGEASLCLFRVAQEALSNAVRHGRASAMTVLARGNGLQLAVSDNGSGSIPNTRAAGSLAWPARALLPPLRGQLDIESALGRTTIGMGAGVKPIGRRCVAGRRPSRWPGARACWSKSSTRRHRRRRPRAGQGGARAET
jgi:signal transduction histidine kinase